MYGYMNGVIFKIFGGAILIFELLLVLIFVLGLPRLVARGQRLEDGLVFFLGFLVLSTVVALGLILLQRWAAITTSIIGLVWSLVLASSLSYAPWESLLSGIPIAFGMLLPLYATVRNWSSLNSLGDCELTAFFHDLRLSDRLHLK